LSPVPPNISTLSLHDALPIYKDRYTEINRYALSNILVEMKQIDKASEHMKWLLDRHPDEPGYYNDLGYIWADHGINLEEAEKLIDRKSTRLNSSHVSISYAVF